MLDRGQLVRGASGRRWMDGALFDVTERRAAEEALRRREIEEARTEELRASRARIVEAADAARRKIERDLHDGAQQRLVAMALEVRLAKARVEKQPDDAAPFLERMAEELEEASSELRELARGIHPAVLTERGLGPAIDALAARAPVPVEILDVPEDRLAPNTETTAYFTVAEALTNVAKYAQAQHATRPAGRRRARELQIEVRDDGVGGAQASTGSGLSGLADRVGASRRHPHGREPAGGGDGLRAVLPVPCRLRRLGGRGAGDAAPAQLLGRARSGRARSTRRPPSAAARAGCPRAASSSGTRDAAAETLSAATVRRSASWIGAATERSPSSSSWSTSAQPWARTSSIDGAQRARAR